MAFAGQRADWKFHVQSLPGEPASRACLQLGLQLGFAARLW